MTIQSHTFMPLDGLLDAMEEHGTDFAAAENPNLVPDGEEHGAALFAEVESLRSTCRELESRLAVAEDSVSDLQIRNLELSRERGSLRIKLIEAEDSARDREEASWMETLELSNEIEILKDLFKEIVEERNRRDGAMAEVLESIRSARGWFSKIGERIWDDDLELMEVENPSLEDTLELLLMESKSLCKLGSAVGSKFMEYENKRRKEEKELENSIVSLTEENRDISSLLRVALMEKEAAEKSLRVKGGEHKRGAILQIAERGLQKVGFGFVMGVIGGDSHSDQPSSSAASVNSDYSDSDEEVASLVSTVDNMMKNLRLQITDLRQTLGESRSQNEHLQSLLHEQTKKVIESEQYIKDLEERANVLAERVEVLTVEIKEAGEEAARWREACELEVEAGRAVILEREKEVSLLSEELKRTKSALDAATNKLHLKEKLAKTAMAAQAAAEATLQLADKRSAGFQERIEELTRQLEEEADRSARRERNAIRRRVRYVCWPWQAFRVTPAARAAPQSWERRRRTMLPEMEYLLRFNM